MASLLSRQHAKMVATCLMMPLALVLAADAFGGCTSVDTETTGTGSSSSKASASVTSSTSTGMGGTGPSTVSSSSTTGTGGSGTGGTGGGMPACKNQNTGTDTCPGDSVNLTPDFADCYAGDTSTANADYASAYCEANGAATAGPDRVYHFYFKKTGSLKLRVRALNKDFPISMHVRGEFGKNAVCTDAVNDDLVCFDFFTSQEAVAQEIDPATFPDLYFFIDSVAGKGGKYQLDVSYTTPKCGDAILNASTNEQCDDGNTVSGDGCDKNCKFETITVFDTCPGEPFSIALNQTLTFSSNTAPYKNDYKPAMQGTCGKNANTSTAQDRVYQVKAKADGTLTATVGYDMSGTVNICDKDPLDPDCWQYVLYALDAVNPDTCGATCTCNPGAQLACSETGIFLPQKIQFPVKNGHSYFIVVDGDDNIYRPFGPFNLNVSLK